MKNMGKNPQGVATFIRGKSPFIMPGGEPIIFCVSLKQMCVDIYDPLNPGPPLEMYVV